MSDNTPLKSIEFCPEVWATSVLGLESCNHLRDEVEQALQVSVMMANMELEAMDSLCKAQDGQLEHELDRIAVRSAMDMLRTAQDGRLEHEHIAVTSAIQDGRLEYQLDCIANGETQFGRQAHAERLKAELEQIVSCSGELYTQVADLRVALRIEIAKTIAAQTDGPQPDDAVRNDARQYNNDDYAIQNIAPSDKAEIRENTAVDRVYTELIEKMEEVKEGQKVVGERMTALLLAVTAPQPYKAEAEEDTAVNTFYTMLMEKMEQVKEGQKVVNERMAALALAVALLAVVLYTRLV